MKGESRAAAEIGKSVCVSAIFTLAAVLVFALVVKLCSLGASVITPVNQIIKMLAVFAGCFLCIRGPRPVVRGLISGVITVAVTFFLFAAIAGELSFGWGILLDLLFGAVAGGISGAISALGAQKVNFFPAAKRLQFFPLCTIIIKKRQRRLPP